MSFTEHMDAVVLYVTHEKTNYSNGPTQWEVTIQTNPKYATPDFDTPIKIATHGGDEELDLELEEAEALAEALLRAVQIRRAAVKGAEPLQYILWPEIKKGG